MNTITPFILLAIAFLLIAGCASPIVTPPDTVTPTLTPAPDVPTVTITPAPDIIPRPTDVVPPSQQVAIQVSRNTVAIDPWVSVLFAGGAGQIYVYEMTGTLIRSDGITEVKTARAPEMGTTLLFNGTLGTDRMIVTIRYTDGNTYTVWDELVPFRGIIPP
ncbi:hypothetical protein ASZ90_014708 [hydrocarbon metagenome]|uniref:Uncharacterized protein n=1 Tax=hydrocarbon metagenome TaxID=938273 RepID=A0A0W8F446_9ZZZZ